MIDRQMGYKMKILSALIVFISMYTTVAIAGVNEDFFKAAGAGNLPEATNLFAKGADVNSKMGNNGYTALILASLHGHKDIVGIAPVYKYLN